MSKYDLIVIGGGPAGYVGAIRAAQLGKRVACVEKERAGGTCLNWGCIPTKSLLRNAELYRLMQNHADEFGLSFDNLSYDWSKVISRSRKVSDRLAGGIEFLFKKNNTCSPFSKNLLTSLIVLLAIQDSFFKISECKFIISIFGNDASLYLFSIFVDKYFLLTILL